MEKITRVIMKEHTRCPKCGSDEVYRTDVETEYAEYFMNNEEQQQRPHYSGKRYGLTVCYHCQECGWEGWKIPEEDPI